MTPLPEEVQQSYINSLDYPCNLVDSGLYPYSLLSYKNRLADHETRLFCPDDCAELDTLYLQEWYSGMFSSFYPPILLLIWFFLSLVGIPRLSTGPHQGCKWCPSDSASWRLCGSYPRSGMPIFVRRKSCPRSCLSSA